MKLSVVLLAISLLVAILPGCSNKRDTVEDIDYKSPGYFWWGDSEGTNYFREDDGNRYYSTHYSTDYPKGLIGTNYRAADSLIKDTHTDKMHLNSPVLITSFVNIDDVQHSSTFGRIIAEQIGSRIAQQGYKVIEMKMRTDNIFVRGNTFRGDEGEFMLSRELRDISLKHDAQAVIVGTYAESQRRVYVTAKLVRTNDSVILTSYDYELPVGPDTKRMLRTRNRQF
ncbi:MAG: hypothetical protein BWK79_04455 [Beggiatoa sp. IS2]|nr:MAG: hypothetical protein BWK79_04455 [Beggiatoa sp. IS2]